MSNKLTLEGLETFKDRINERYSGKNHVHSNYVSKSDIGSICKVSSVNGMTGDVVIDSEAYELVESLPATGDPNKIYFAEHELGTESTNNYYTKEEVETLLENAVEELTAEEVGSALDNILNA